MPRPPLPLLLIALLASSLSACKPREQKAAAGDELTETMQPQNGLITVHYPASFHAKKTGEGSVVVSSSAVGGAALAFTAIDKSPATDLKEYVGIIEPAQTKTHDQYAETSRKPATCNGQPGIEITGTYHSQSGKLEARRACHFLRNGHGYSYHILAAKEVMAAEEALFVKIREAAQFNR